MTNFVTYDHREHLKTRWLNLTQSEDSLGKVSETTEERVRFAFDLLRKEVESARD